MSGSSTTAAASVGERSRDRAGRRDRGPGRARRPASPRDGNPARIAMSSAWSCEQADHGGTDGAAAQQPHADRSLGHVTSARRSPDRSGADPSAHQHSRPRNRRTCATAVRASPRRRTRTCGTERWRRCCADTRTERSSRRPRSRAQANASAIRADADAPCRDGRPRPRSRASPRGAVTGWDSRWMKRCPTTRPRSTATICASRSVQDRRNRRR